MITAPVWHDVAVCICCAFAIANGDTCDCEPGEHPHGVAGGDDFPNGTLALTAISDDDAGVHFATSPCGVCGSRLAGDRMPAAWCES